MKRSKIRSHLRICSAFLAGALIVSGLHAIAFADTATAVSATKAGVTPKFTRRAYVGAGFGSSMLKPEDECPCLGVSDKSSTGHNLMVGYDLARWLSAEVYFADLGSAEVEFLGTDVGPVDYSVANVSAIGYLFNSQSGWMFANNGRGLHRREGLSLYTRVGLGTIDNDTDLDYHRDYPVHVAVGLGAEYGFKNGFALRGEYTAFDADAQYASVSLLKRFGSVAESAAVVPVAAVAAPLTDVAADPVTAIETPQFSATVAPFVYFGFDDHKLSATAQVQLKAYATELKQSEYSFVVEGHADWMGSADYNMALSSRRAKSVYDFLIAQGISASRIAMKAYGETRPNSSNTTATGRAQNRRVEFFID